MSAPDDKISSNRRRLFKALSTAPVVMTLKPGAALANSSAFQCVEKIADPATDPNLTEYGPDPTPGFVSNVYDYFKLPAQIPDNCVLKNLNDDFVVYIDNELYGNKNPGIPILQDGYSYQPGTDEVAGTLKLLQQGNSGNSCLDIDGEKGHFALLGDLSPSDPTFAGEPFPKANPAPQAGLQGITGTCLASFYGVPQSGSLI